MVSLSHAFCPQCEDEAFTESAIDKRFGFRTMRNGTVRPQSNCKKCRVKIQRQRKRLGQQVSRIYKRKN